MTLTLLTLWEKATFLRRRRNNELQIREVEKNLYNIEY